MRTCRELIWCFVLLGGLFALSLRLSSEWEKKLTVYPEGMDLLRSQAADDEDEDGWTRAPRKKRTEKGTSQKIWIDKRALNAKYTFINFNKDRLFISYSMPSRAYLDYLAGYGYSDADIARLRKWREKTRQSAWNLTIRKAGKAAAEKAVAAVDLDYETKLRKLLRSRGLALRAGNVVECDMPVIVKRNVPVLKPLALAFQKISSARGYGAEETVGAVLSMVQTALRYKIPPSLEGQLHTGGLLPPARALLSGWGDCDTKTGAAAAILGNWSRMRLVGIAVPGHYLMAIRRIPAKGDMFVRYKGLEYVLIEPAGPAWLEPGTVGRATSALLERGEGYRVEPFF